MQGDEADLVVGPICPAGQEEAHLPHPGLHCPEHILPSIPKFISHPFGIVVQGHSSPFFMDLKRVIFAATERIETHRGGTVDGQEQKGRS